MSEAERSACAGDTARMAESVDALVSNTNDKGRMVDPGSGTDETSGQSLTVRKFRFAVLRRNPRPGIFAAGPDRECPGVFFSVAACLACTTVQIALSHRWLEGSVSVLWNGCGGRGHACRGGRRLGEPEFPAVPLFCRGLCRRRPVRLSAANVAALRAFAANVSLASGSRRALRHDARKDEPDARLVRPEAEILPSEPTDAMSPASPRPSSMFSEIVAALFSPSAGIASSRRETYCRPRRPECGKGIATGHEQLVALPVEEEHGLAVAIDAGRLGREQRLALGPELFVGGIFRANHLPR